LMSTPSISAGVAVLNLASTVSVLLTNFWPTTRMIFTSTLKRLTQHSRLVASRLP
jgi:hypothetical protein